MQSKSLMRHISWWFNIRGVSGVLKYQFCYIFYLYSNFCPLFRVPGVLHWQIRGASSQIYRRSLATSHIPQVNRPRLQVTRCRLIHRSIALNCAHRMFSSVNRLKRSQRGILHLLVETTIFRINVIELGQRKVRYSIFYSGLHCLSLFGRHNFWRNMVQWLHQLIKAPWLFVTHFWGLSLRKHFISLEYCHLILKCLLTINLTDRPIMFLAPFRNDLRPLDWNYQKRW